MSERQLYTSFESLDGLRTAANNVHALTGAARTRAERALDEAGARFFRSLCSIATAQSLVSQTDAGELSGCDPRYQVVRFAAVDPDEPLTGSVALFYEQADTLVDEFHTSADPLRLTRAIVAPKITRIATTGGQNGLFIYE